MSEQPYACPVPNCSKCFGSKFNLKRHIDMVHLGCNRFICSQCRKVLKSKQNLEQHLHIHIGDRPFRCPEPGCGQNFRQGSLLSLHKKSHKVGVQTQVECCLNVRPK